jgi:hypothetical protein
MKTPDRRPIHVGGTGGGGCARTRHRPATPRSILLYRPAIGPTMYRSVRLDQQAGVKRRDISIFMFRSFRIGIWLVVRK